MATSDNLDSVTESGEGIVVWRLGRVEKALEELDKKLDAVAALKDTVIVHSEKIASLEKSRDRMIAAVSILGTGTIMLGIQQLARIIQ